jgi:hypothetical protein
MKRTRRASGAESFGRRSAFPSEKYFNAVTLNAAIPANVKVTLSIGTLEENVTVVGESSIVVQTKTPSIATNITGEQITSLPLTSRNALDALTSLPGFNTSGTARNSTVNGLPKGAIKTRHSSSSTTKICGSRPARR